MSRAVLVAILAGCTPAATPPPIAKPAPPAPAPAKDPTGDEIIDAAIDTYAHLASYRDTGTLTTEYAGSPAATETATFSTVFARDKWLAVEFHASKAREWALYADPAHAFVLQPKKVEDFGTDLDTAQGSLAGVTHLTTSLVPDMLRGGNALLDRIEEPALAGKEDIGGKPAWHVAGAAGKDRKVDVWIDVASHLVVKFVEHAHVARAGLDVLETRELTPEASPALDDKSLVPPPFPTAPVAIAQPSWVGVRLEPNARVKMVIPGSPAARAGFAVGDRVVTVDGGATPDANEATLRLRNAKIGVAIDVVVERAGAKQTIAVTPETLPDPIGMIRAALVGKPAQDLDANMKGAVVILDFWATWCKPCLVTMPRLDKLAQKYAARGLRVVGYTDEAVPLIAAFRAQHPITYALQQDANDEIAGHYLVQGIPQLVVIDRKGVVRTVSVGAGNLRDVERLVKSLL